MEDMIATEAAELNLSGDSLRFYRRARLAGFPAAVALDQVAQMRAAYAANYLTWKE